MACAKIDPVKELPMTHLITQSATIFCQIASAIFMTPSGNILLFSYQCAAVVKYWGAGRQRQIARNWCRQWNAMINNKLGNFRTPSAARFLKTSPATLNEIIWSITLITANKRSWCNCVVSLLIDWHIMMLLGYLQAKGWQNMGPDFAIITNQGTGRSTKSISFSNLTIWINTSWNHDMFYGCEMLYQIPHTCVIQ